MRKRTCFLAALLVLMTSCSSGSDPAPDATGATDALVDTTFADAVDSTGLPDTTVPDSGTVDQVVPIDLGIDQVGPLEITADTGQDVQPEPDLEPEPDVQPDPDTAGQDEPPVLWEAGWENMGNGKHRVFFSLSHPQSLPIAVDVEYSEEGAEFAPVAMFVGVAPWMETSPGGKKHEGYWLGQVDVGKGVDTSVQLRLTPRTETMTGEPTVLGPTPVAVAPFALEDVTERMPELTGDTRSFSGADVDGDGDLDIGIAVADDQNYLMVNSGEATFETVPLIGGQRETSCLEIADFTGDGAPDIFVANVNQQSQMLVNDGTGEFTEIPGLLPEDLTFQIERVLPGDVDQDGDIDVVLLCSGSQPERLLLNDGTGKLTDVTGDAMPPDTLMAAAGSLGDVNGDDFPDLAFANFISSQTTQLWLNDGSGGFVDSSSKIQPAYESMGFDALFVDLDADGDLDLFEANLWNVQRIMLNDGAGTFTEFVSGVPGDLGYGQDGVVMASDASAGDINLDGQQDVFIACSGNTLGMNQNILLLGSGPAFVSPYSPSPFPEGGDDSRHALPVDLDGDGDLELVIANAYSQSKLYLNQ